MATVRDHYLKSRAKDVRTANESAARNNVEPTAKQKARMERLKEKKKNKIKTAVIRSTVILCVIAICLAGFLITYNIFNDRAVDPENTNRVAVTVTENMTDDEVGAMLLEAGCIKDVKLYKVRCLIYDADYVPGKYKVSPSFTTEKIINILSGYDYSDGTIDENDTVDESETTTAQAETTEETGEANDENQDN